MALEKYVSERRLGYFKGKIDAAWKVKNVKVNGAAVTPDANGVADLKFDHIKFKSDNLGGYGIEFHEGDPSYVGDHIGIRWTADESPTDGFTLYRSNDYPFTVPIPSKEYVDKNMPLLETEETTIGDGYNLAAIKHNKTDDKSGVVIKKPDADTAVIDWFGKNGTSENSVTLPTKDYVDNNAGKIDKIRLNTVEQQITNKEVSLFVPVLWVTDTYFQVNDGQETKGVRFTQSTNGYQIEGVGDNVPSTKELVDKTYVDATFRTEAQVEAAIAEAQTGAFVKVASYDDLPSEGAAGKIYLVPNSGSGQNVYDEYIWCVVAMMAGGGGGESPVYGYEKIGTTAVDLTGYVQESDLVEVTEAEIDAMFA